MTPTEDELFPIRDLSQRCMVNTVTIRAWERRYGLLNPQRTAKGHRLYSKHDISRVKDILKWMERGVPISRVKSLLDSDSSEAPSKTDSWAEPIIHMSQIASKYSHQEIQRLLHEHLLSYPAELCLAKLIEPVMSSLVNKNDNKAVYHYLASELIQYALIRLGNQGKKAKGERLVLVCGENTAIWRLALMALALDNSNVNIEFINQAMDVQAWLALCSANSADQCLVYQDGLWSQSEKKQISTIAPSLARLNLCGTAPMVSDIKHKERCFESPMAFSSSSLGRQIINK